MDRILQVWVWWCGGVVGIYFLPTSTTHHFVIPFFCCFNIHDDGGGCLLLLVGGERSTRVYLKGLFQCVQAQFRAASVLWAVHVWPHLTDESASASRRGSLTESALLLATQAHTLGQQLYELRIRFQVTLDFVITVVVDICHKKKSSNPIP